ncbi:hypothetical protein DFH08DRAFT_816990 [Mycena albidolilacea]|uniref:Uncharacterized protein n=1 Tax=Mycena albidolilacea TaxID=1033008 RepID=A0AAD7EI64_9AGAR|nr:hypothetical protein DFH08DRAFT_816990 [Mycena albidolilacea]
MDLITPIFKEIGSFRLGYTEERPSTWRWTTPIVLCTFLLAAALLAAINVPLSAYNIIQEFTYHPNDTLPPLPLSNFIPSFLQNPTTGFTPQILTIGDVIKPPGSIFNYTIVEAFDTSVTNHTGVSSFSYYNNPLFDGCDVIWKSDLTWQWWPDILIEGVVTCHLPTTTLHLTWSGFPPGDSDDGGYPAAESPQNMLTYTELDFVWIFIDWWSGPTSDPGTEWTEASISFTVFPCCDCDAALEGAPPETAYLLQQPCASRAPGFVAVNRLYSQGNGVDDKIVPSIPETLMTVAHYLATIATDYLGDLPLSRLEAAYQNLFQTVYHLVRLDLGVITENQIYNSPRIYNHTIVTVDMPPQTPLPIPPPPYYDNILRPSTDTRGFTSNATLMAQWKKEVNFFKTTDRVPAMEYLRPVPRLKPLGFSDYQCLRLDIRYAVGDVDTLKRNPEATFRDSGTTVTGYVYSKSNLNSAEWDQASDVTLIAGPMESKDRLLLDIETSNIQTRFALAHMLLALVRMRRALKRHGLVDDADGGEDMEMDFEPTGPRKVPPGGIIIPMAPKRIVCEAEKIFRKLGFNRNVGLLGVEASRTATNWIIDSTSRHASSKTPTADKRATPSRQVARVTARRAEPTHTGNCQVLEDLTLMTTH